MTRVVPSPRAPRERRFDWVGFAALSVFPAIATFQGVVAAVGVWQPFDTTTALIIPIVVILLCLAARSRLIPLAFAQPEIARASWYLIAYLVIVLASTALVYLDPIERDPSRMMQQFLSTAPAALVFFVMAASPTPASAIRALHASMLVWMVAAVVTPLTAFTPLPIGEVQGAYEGSQALRSFGVLSDGGTFVISFLTVAYFSSRRPLLFVLCLSALILSGSRTALVLTGIGIAAVFLLEDSARKQQQGGELMVKAILAVFASVLVLLAMQFVFSFASEQFGISNAIDRLKETDISQNDRLFSVIQGLEWVQESWLFGHGFNSYYYFSLRSFSFGANQSNALNQMTQTLMDGGVLALLFLVLFFFQVLWSGKGRPLVDRRNDPYALKAWLLIFVVVNQTAVYILPAFFLTALVFGLAGLSLYIEATGDRGLRNGERNPRLLAA